MISRSEIDEAPDVPDPLDSDRSKKESPFEGWPAAEALESLPASVQEALVSLKTDVSALRAVATALPRRLKRVGQIKVLRKKTAMRRLGTIVVASAFAGVIACMTVGLAITMVLYGVAAGTAALLGLPLWAGLGLTGFGLLALISISALVAWRRYAAARLAATRSALEKVGLSHFSPSAAQSSTP